jgi:hypothetical protein
LLLIGKAPRGALLTVAALALGCLIAACGSASNSSGSAGASSTTGTTASAAAGGAGGANPARRAALTACLKQHGVTLPARPPGAPGGGPPPGGGTGTGTGTGTTGTGTTGTGTGTTGPGTGTTGTGTGTTGTGTTPGRGFFGGGGGFANNPKLRAAFQACGARFGFGGAGDGFRGRLTRTNITKYVSCVRQHGYNLPNPNFSGKGPVFPANIRSNAKFQAASRACQSLLVPPRPSGSGSGTGTSTASGA